MNDVRRGMLLHLLRLLHLLHSLLTLHVVHYLVDVVEREARYVRDEDGVEGGGDAEVVCRA